MSRLPADPHLSLIEELPVLHRLALSYAPSAAREPTLALLAFDMRLAAILRAAREPMLAQLRLAWWREQMKAEPSSWPTGDPLLAALRSWGERRPMLAALVEGWEALTGSAPLSPEALASLAQARGRAFADLAEVVGAPGDREEAMRAGTNWALADMASHLSDPTERSSVFALAEDRDWRGAKLNRRLRPLVVLHGLAARPGEAVGKTPQTALPLLKALRLGILGR
jgi:phytoene synthase